MTLNWHYTTQERLDHTWHYRYTVLRLSGMNQDKIFRVMAELAKLGV